MHLLDALVEFRAAHDSEVFVKKSPVQTLGDAIALRPTNLGRAVFDFFKLQEELERMMVGPAAILATVVRQNRPYFGMVFLKEGQDAVVQ